MESSRAAASRTGRRRRDLTGVVALQQRIALRDFGTQSSLNLILEATVRIVGASGAMFESAGAGGWSSRGVAGCFAPDSAGTSRVDPSFGMKAGTGLSICNDTLADTPAVREACGTVGARSIATVPLERGGENAFILTVVSGEPGAFDAADLEVLQLLAGFAMTAALEADLAPRTEAETSGGITTLMAAVQRENQFAKLLQEIAVAANEAANVEEAIRRSLVRICEVTGWPMGHLYLTSGGGDRLVSTPVWHMSHSIRFNALRRLTDGMEWRRNVGLPGRVLADGRPSWVVDIRTDPSIVRTRLATSLGVRSAFALPLLIGSEVVAVLEFFSEQLLAPDERLLEIAGHIGVQLGRVIERKRAKIVLAASEQHYRLLFERNLAGVFRITLDGRILDCNDAFGNILGYDSREELRTRSMLDLYPESPERTEHFERLEAGRTLTNAEMLMQRKDGSRVWTLVNASLISQGELQVIEGTILDITARKQEELRVEFQANHDPLTKLHNRASFRAQLDRSMALARRCETPLALLFLDLDGFKPINDTLGHAAGDLLLQETAARLVDSVRGSDLVARLGGDEFVVLLTTLTSAGDAESVAQKLLTRIGAPVSYHGRDLTVTASIGIGLCPNDAVDADQLIAAADRAMYMAKKAGGNGYRSFVSGLDRSTS
ncbi:MAG TPA: diguanylate cyclase [Thermoanaerobaculia bacterium]|nr:diguanylate cyclase [Thermoanaerobaculia bacterium]